MGPEFNTTAGAANNPGALNGVLLLGSLVPGVLHLSAAFLAWRYPLNSARHDAIRDKLRRGRLPHATDAEPAPETAS